MKSEAAVQTEVRLETCKKGVRLWRNNVGALQDASGRYVRYGLANESKKINDVIKSSDLIGITPTVITPDMVGQTVGIFTSYEVKHEGWKYSGSPREQAQAAWLTLVKNLGGIAAFVSSLDDL